MATDFPRKPVRTLQALCQVEIIKNLHEKASKLHRDYFDNFCSALNPMQISQERRLDIRNLDPPKVVKDFEEKLKAREENEKKLKGKIMNSNGTSSKREGLRASTLRKRPYETPQSKKNSSQVPPRVGKTFQLLGLSRELSIIPSGVPPSEYVKYRKCKLIVDIHSVRQYLYSLLNCRVGSNLMSTLENILMCSIMSSRHRNRDDGRECTVLLMIQNMLTNPDSTVLNMNNLKLWNNLAFYKLGGSLLGSNFLNDNEIPCMEVRIETSLVHFALKNGQKLTTIKMSGAACDNFCQVISENCVNLKYLDISDSHVSNQGLYYLAGVTEEASRSSKFARKCKKVDKDQEGLDKNLKMVKTRKGCELLTHLIAYGLKKVTWITPNLQSNISFISMISNTNNNNSSNVKCPKDSGFIMILKHLPNLKVFLNERGGKVMETLMSEKRRQKIGTLHNLEVISDHQVNKNGMRAILQMCPNLKSILVKPDQRGKDESWLEVLNGNHKIQAITVSESTFKGPNLCNLLLDPVNGGRLTCLDLRELCYFQLSWFQKMKQNCQNLQKLVIGINTRMTIHALHFHQIDIVNDFNLGNGDGKEDPELKNLELCHLHGPFGPEITSYMIKGAQDLKNLVLMIEWMDANFMSIQPSDKDYLGIDYLKELLKVNPLCNLSQLHLGGGVKKKNRAKLDKNCVSFVLNTFGDRLEHFGSFDQWNLSRSERASMTEEFTNQNRKIILDEHLRSRQVEKVDFSKKFVENRIGFSCQDPTSLLTDQFDERHNDFMDLFDVIAGLHGFFEANEGPDDSDSDDSIMESDDGDDVFVDDVWMN